LRLGLIQWHHKVYRKCYKSISKGLRVELKKLFKSFELEDSENHIEDEEEKGDKRTEEDGESLIAEVKNSLVDLSLQLGSAKFLQHSSFSSLTGSEDNSEVDLIEKPKIQTD